MRNTRNTNRQTRPTKNERPSARKPDMRFWNGGDITTEPLAGLFRFLSASEGVSRRLSAR